MTDGSWPKIRRVDPLMTVTIRVGRNGTTSALRLGCVWIISSCNPHAHRIRGRRSELLSTLAITITTANEDTFTSTGCQSADLVTDLAHASSLFRENQSPQSS